MQLAFLVVVTRKAQDKQFTVTISLHIGETSLQRLSDVSVRNMLVSYLVLVKFSNLDKIVPYISPASQQ